MLGYALKISDTFSDLFVRKRFSKVTVTIKVAHSEQGMVSQTPVIPKIPDRIKMKDKTATMPVIPENKEDDKW